MKALDSGGSLSLKSLLLRKAIQMACERDQEPTIQAKLTVNGREIELSNFVQDFMGLAVAGMIGSLKGVADIQTATLNISRPKEQ